MAEVPDGDVMATTGDRTVITGGTVVTADAEGRVLHDGYVVLEGTQIAAVGSAGDSGAAEAEGAARVVDASGRIVLPGLVDLHCHTAVVRGGYTEALDLDAALFDHWYPMMRGVSAEVVEHAARYSYAEQVRRGTTTVNDMFRQVAACARAAEAIGVRATLASLVADGEHGLDTCADNAEAYRAVHGSAGGRVQVAVGLEWLPLSSPDLLREAAALADDLGAGIHLHLSETEGEVAACEERFGRRPVAVAAEFGLLGPRTVAAHCVYLDDAEITVLAATGTHVSHNPAANCKMGSGIARLPELLAAGVNVGLGHDSVEGNNSHDLFSVMRTCGYLHRGMRRDARAVVPADLLQMATANGARALGVPAGRLAPGEKADVVVVDSPGVFRLDHPAYRENVVTRLAFATSGTQTRTVFVDGRLVVDEGRLVTADEEELAERARWAVTEIDRLVAAQGVRS